MARLTLVYFRQKTPYSHPQPRKGPRVPCTGGSDTPGQPSL